MFARSVVAAGGGVLVDEGGGGVTDGSGRYWLWRFCS